MAYNMAESQETTASSSNSKESVSDSSESVTNGLAQNTVVLTAEQAEEAARIAEAKRQKEIELGKYWKTVEDNPMDFTGWTYLLQYVEQECNTENSRLAYEAFFSHYPYCYGYWKKYSDMEKKQGNLIRAKEVFEKGIRAIPLSVELWLHYLNFYIAEFGPMPGEQEKIRKLYERALAAAGKEFRSDKLWDSFISWENMIGNLKGVTAIYDRLVSTPTQLYSHHWDNFKRHINIHHPKETLDIDTFLKIRSEVLNKTINYQIDDEDEVGLDEALQVGEGPDADAPPGMVATTGDEKELKKVRQRFLEKRDLVFKVNEEEVSKRWTFEETIRRPYFHVKPLERGQLKNWREYLDFEISQNDHHRIVVLFERCMIACALYEDFWMKYAKYLEQHSLEGVRSVYQRACDIHLPKKPYIHLAWTAFEERRGNYALARKILMNIESNVPGLAVVCMRRISLERRNKNHKAAEELFKTYIDKAVSHKTKMFFSIKYARYLQKIIGDTDRARKILMDALNVDNTNEKIFLQLLDVEYQAQPIVEERVMDAFSQMLKSDVSLEFKVKVSQRRMEFLEDFGECIKRISEAYDEHQRLVKEMNSKKRKPEKDKGAEESQEKRAKTDTQAAPHAPHPTDHVPPAPAPPPPMSHPMPPDPNYDHNNPSAWSSMPGYGSMPGGYMAYPYPAYPQYNYYGY